MKDVMITGCDGMVGSYIDFGVRLNRDELDVTDEVAVMEACKKYQPHTIIHLAAATDLVRCEQDPPYAYRVNAIGTYHVALAARSVEANLIYVSTSGVFDGTKQEPYTEEDIPNPVNIYGHSKYLGELAVRGVLSNFLIVRTSWVFGGGKEKDSKFVGKVLSQIHAPEIKAVADKRGSPTYAKDLVSAIRVLIENGRNGTIHLGGGDATRYDVAKEIVSILGSTASVVPVHSKEFPSAYNSGQNESMPRPRLMRSWQDALREYIETEMC